MRGISGVLVILAVTLVGCSDAAEPSALSSPTVTSTRELPSAEPRSSTAAQSAADSLEVYLDVANDSLTNAARLDDWRALFADSCKVCLAGYESTSGIHAAGQKIQGGQLRGRSVQQTEVGRDEAVFVVRGHLASAEVTANRGQQVESYESLPGVTIVYTLKRVDDGSWLVIGGELVQ